MIKTAATAKYVCSGVFLSGLGTGVVKRDWTRTTSETEVVIDLDEKFVTASCRGVTGKAIFREGLGCTLVGKTPIANNLITPKAVFSPKPVVSQNELWPDGNRVQTDTLIPGLNKTALERALDEEFKEIDPKRKRQTRAVVVVYNGRIVAERYAPGFMPQIRFLSWSVGKSITNALVGILVKQGRLRVNNRAPVPEWNDPNDPRRHITLDHLLKMSSGLKFNERSTVLCSEVFTLLFASDDMAAYAVRRPLEAKPGTRWNYSSGDSSIIARIIRHTLEASGEDYYSFPYRRLFSQIGMQTALIEVDASGTFVNAGWMWATARDYARFGLLYLNDGIWKGQRILPEGWVDYTGEPMAQAPKGMYGAHFWLNSGEPSNIHNRFWPELSRDTYTASGNRGQWITIIPSRKTVVVRFGFSQGKPDEWAIDHELFVSNLLRSLPGG